MNKKILILSFLSVLFLAAGPIRAAIGVTNLRTEQLKNPSGIDTHQPRLGWRIESNEQNVMQTAYHLPPIYWHKGKEICGIPEK